MVTGTTPKVQYTYDLTASGGFLTNGARMSVLKYPNLRQIFYDYGTANSLTDRLLQPWRVRETNGAGAILAEYSLTGGGSAVITDYQQPDLKLDYFQGTSGTYAGLDRFGRVIDQFWDGYNATADAARVGYGYDRVSNRTWVEDHLAEAASVNLDELYAYDGLNSLLANTRGEINAGHTAISGNTLGEAWELDPLGNWQNYTLDGNGDGTHELDQDRTHSAANEITAITATSGTNWVDPIHDAAGNLTTGPKPGDEATTQKYVFDAWNRLVKVTDGSNVTIAAYEYDGLNRRIVKELYTGGTLTQTRHAYCLACVRSFGVCPVFAASAR